MDTLLQKTRRALEDHEMIHEGDAVIVGVSGGADSVALLLILKELAAEWNLRLVAAHLDHSARGEESRQDAEFVKSLARDLGLDFVSEKRDVAGESSKPGASFQETARKIRGDFLESVRLKHNAQKIALGHTLEDQVETVLMNFLRGSGTRGLGGMRPVRGNVIRPLYHSSRDEILSFLESRKRGFREDSSNAKPDYLRNRIRLELMPLIRKDFNPNIHRNIFEASRILQWEDEFLSRICREEFEKTGGREPEDQKIFLQIHRLNSLPRALKARLVREAYRMGKGDLRRLSFFHVQQVMALLAHPQSGKSVSLPDDWVAVVRGEKLLFHKISEPKSRILNGDSEPERVYPLQVPGETALDVPGVILIARLEPARPDIVRNEVHPCAHLDWEKTGTGLSIRFFRPGDRFRPLGMRGTKKLKDFLIDRKIPREQRKTLPLLTSARGDIIWVYGVRISENYKVTPETKNVLIIEGLTRPP